MERTVEPALDYSTVRTLEDFQRWAASALKLPYSAGATQRDIAVALFSLLNVDEQYLVVSEVNRDRMSADMLSLMTDSTHGLYSVLGFHLPREGKGAVVAFRRLGER